MNTSTQTNVVGEITKPIYLNPDCQVIRGYFTSNGRYNMTNIHDNIMILINDIEEEMRQIEPSCENKFLYAFIYSSNSDALRNIAQCNFFLLPKTLLANGYIRALKNSIHKIFAVNRGLGVDSCSLFPNFKFSAVVYNKPQYPQPTFLINFIQLYKNDSSTLTTNCIEISNYFNFLKIENDTQTSQL